MSWVGTLAVIRDILKLIKELLTLVKAAAKRKRMKKATDKAEVKGDQQDVEKEVSTTSGQPTKHKYDKLRTGPAKKRRD